MHSMNVRGLRNKSAPLVLLLLLKVLYQVSRKIWHRNALHSSAMRFSKNDCALDESVFATGLFLT